MEVQLERPRVEFNFSMQFKPGEFEKMTPDQKQRFFQDYLQQINCVLMGAIIAGKDKLDFILKINADLLNNIVLPPEVETLLKSKGMIVSVVYVQTGQGVMFT